jgi:hypothetical protein
MRAVKAICISHVIVCNTIICFLIPQRTPMLSLVTELVMICINFNSDDNRSQQIISMLEGAFIAVIFQSHFHFTQELHGATSQKTALFMLQLCLAIILHYVAVVSPHNGTKVRLCLRNIFFGSS